MLIINFILAYKSGICTCNWSKCKSEETSAKEVSITTAIMATIRTAISRATSKIITMIKAIEGSLTIEGNNPIEAILLIPTIGRSSTSSKARVTIIWTRIRIETLPLKVISTPTPVTILETIIVIKTTIKTNPIIKTINNKIIPIITIMGIGTIRITSIATITTAIIATIKITHTTIAGTMRTTMGKAAWIRVTDMVETGITNN
jgi:hypothetical protein